MAHVSLSQNTPVFARRLVNGASQYMPDASTKLNKDGTSDSDAWGTAALSGIASTDGFRCHPRQTLIVWAPGNTGTINIEKYNPIAAAWQMIEQITDAKGRNVTIPGGGIFRIGTPSSGYAGATEVCMETLI